MTWLRRHTKAYRGSMSAVTNWLFVLGAATDRLICEARECYAYSTCTLHTVSSLLYLSYLPACLPACLPARALSLPA
jgi:hypothetical protein